MVELTDDTLPEIGLKAAAATEGLGVVDRVKVRTGLDMTDQPIHMFYYLIDHGRDLDQRGMSRVRLLHNLRDALTVRDDQRLPHVTIMNRAEWDSREGA